MRLPPVLRSRLALLGQSQAETALGLLPLTLQGTTYTMAQEATVLDAEHFAVGRWDGSLDIYRFDSQGDTGPLISKAVNCPAQEGVQMIVVLDDRSMASSNDEQSVALWTCPNAGDWDHLHAAAELRFDASWGVVNSGALAAPADRDPQHFLAGHASGFLSIWEGAGVDWRLLRGVDVRAARPVNPWGLHNIRGIEVVAGGTGGGVAILGSEDGDLTVFEFPSGRILSKAPYNASAQRGINALAIRDRLLLVANCAVGPSDRNLWAYTVDPVSGCVVCTDSVNLAVDVSAPQIFNFDVIWGGDYQGSPAFFASTEEGVLWMGSASGVGRITIAGNVPVSYAPQSKELLRLGSGICYRANRIAVAGYDVTDIEVTTVNPTATI
jgi:hypothetical protein